MKQFFVLISMILLGGIAAPYHPVWGLLLYYSFAVLRPQDLWKWALPEGWRWSLYAALIVIVGTAINFHKLVIRGRITAVTGMLIIYGFWLMLSCVNALNPAVAQYWAIEYGKVLLIALIASMVINEFWHIRVFGVMILTVLGYIAWEINYQYFFENRRLDVFHHGFGGLDNNGAGLMLAMGLPFGLSLVLAGRLIWHRVGAGVMTLLIAHAVMMTYSRGAMLAAVVGCAWMIMQHRVRHQALLIGVVGCLAVSVLAGTEIRDRFMSTTDYSNDKSAQSRLESWSAAWKMAWEHPLTGHGIRNSNQYTQNYGADRQGRTIHSIYLQIAADSGIPAMIAYIGLLAAAFLSLRRVRKRLTEELQTILAHRRPDHHTIEVRRIDLTAAAIQGSLIVFAFGASFLSVELFELPWLLLVLAGVFPVANNARLAELRKDDDPVDAQDMPEWRPLGPPAPRLAGGGPFDPEPEYA